MLINIIRISILISTFLMYTHGVKAKLVKVWKTEKQQKQPKLYNNNYLRVDNNRGFDYLSEELAVLCENFVMPEFDQLFANIEPELTHKQSPYNDHELLKSNVLQPNNLFEFQSNLIDYYNNSSENEDFVDQFFADKIEDKSKRKRFGKDSSVGAQENNKDGKFQEIENEKPADHEQEVENFKNHLTNIKNEENGLTKNGVHIEEPKQDQGHKIAQALYKNLNDFENQFYKYLDESEKTHKKQKVDKNDFLKNNAKTEENSEIIDYDMKIRENPESINENHKSNSKELDHKIDKTGGFASPELSGKMRKNGISQENSPKISKKNRRLKKPLINIKTKNKIIKPTYLKQLNEAQFNTMISRYKAKRENRWKSIEILLENKEREASENLDKNVGNLSEKERQKMEEAQSDGIRQIIMAGKLIDTAVFCLQIVLMPMPNLILTDENGAFIFDGEQTIKRILCTLIGPIPVVAQLNNYLSKIRIRLASDNGFDFSSAFIVTTNLKTLLNQVPSNCIESYRYYLEIYYKIFGTIERNLAKIEYIVEESEELLFEWLDIQLFVRDFVREVQEFWVIVSTADGIENIKQEKCANLEKK